MSFFFCCYGGHRDLHSFPTRRSSDLLSDNLAELNVQRFQEWVPEFTLDKDRKSTRLNSSHVAISYAVFCLKKKTQEKQDQVIKSISAQRTNVDPVGPRIHDGKSQYTT